MRQRIMRIATVSLLALALTACGASDDSSSDDESIVIVDDGTGGEQTEATDPGEASTNEGLVVSEEPCETDADCVPAGCCHAAACVAQANAPDCSDVMCSADCQFGTLDCGGACLCHEGRCAARLSEAPDVGEGGEPQ